MPIAVAANDIVFSNLRDPDVDADSYFRILIDLDNAGGAGPYKHPADAKALVLAAVHGTFIKNTISDRWMCGLATILAIDATEATIGGFRFGLVGLRDTSKIQSVTSVDWWPYGLNTEVGSGDFAKIATSWKTTTDELNTGMTVDDVSGVGRTPAVGDLLLRVTRLAGSGKGIVHYHIPYWVVR